MFMKVAKRMLAMVCSLALIVSLCACSKNEDTSKEAANSNKAQIESALNLANNENQEWTYSSDADAWVLSIVSAVTNPEIPDQQGVSVCVPGAYISGIDTDGDGTADVTSESYSDAVKGSLVIDYDASVTSTNGQVYTASTAPVVLNTGAAGYASQNNSAASTTYAAEGYINVACGNRGKQDTATDENGDTYYTGDAPSCLVDQKAAARFVKYNILLGNLPGSVDYFVSTGGSGGGAHAVMFAATSNHSDFYDYQIEAGAVGVYKNDDGSYSTTVRINDKEVELSDGAWGCIAYSPITSLYEADMALAFEYYLDDGYDFNTSFQAKLAEYLSAEYMDYINNKNLSVKESEVGFDLNGDGDADDTVDVKIEYDESKYPDTNGYGGTYLDLYLAEFTENLQWYVDSLDYAEDWTWFDENGSALSDIDVAAMTAADKAKAFIEGRYTKSSSGLNGMGGPGAGGMGGPGAGGIDGEMPNGDFPDGGTMRNGEMPNGDFPDGGTMRNGEKPDGDFPDKGTMPNGEKPSVDFPDGGTMTNGEPDGAEGSGEMEVGTPDSGTTQSSTGSTDSSNYSSYDEMLEAYKADIEEIYAGDKYGKNIVSLYNPLNYIGNENTENPQWTRILMGAAEGDMTMFSSLNLQLAWLNVGVDSDIEWQWDGGHVPSEIFGDSLPLYVDTMYGKYVEGAAEITKPSAEKQTANGTSTEQSGTDLSSWVSFDDSGAVSFTLADIAAYRTAGASKATPGFDVIDYGQEDYVFGSTDKDARHWDEHLLDILEKNSETLSPLFNQS